MRRILMVLTVTALMAAMMMATAMPAFALSSPKANCLGELASHLEPGTKGQFVSHEATTTKGVGEEAKYATKLPREADCSGGF